MKIFGVDDKLESAWEALGRRQPVLLYGPTGSGKTIIAWDVAQRYAKDNGDMPVVYLQLYPEMTKNNLIGGETIENGSIVIKEQPILTMGGEGNGAVFIVDECTHTTEPVLLAFNSLIEEPYSTVIGRKIHSLDKKTRFIFCGNLPDHTGNIHLPISFANRLFIIKTDLPDRNTLCDIGRQAARGAIQPYVPIPVEDKFPSALIEFVADIILKTHEAAFPISPRNMIMCIKSIIPTPKSGYKKGSSKPPKQIQKICKKFDINPDVLKEAILSSLMAHIVTKSLGPDKVEALLW